MKTSYKHKIKWIIALLFLQFSIAQSTLFLDEASNYSSWVNASNLGTGFSSWDLWTQNTDASHFAGHFIGNSTAQGFGCQIQQEVHFPCMQTQQVPLFKQMHNVFYPIQVLLLLVVVNTYYQGNHLKLI